MDKYTKILIMAIKIPVGIFCILTGLGLIGVSVWVSTFSVIASMILLIALLGGGALINYGLGYAFWEMNISQRTTSEVEIQPLRL